MTDQEAEQLHRMLAEAGVAPCTLCGRLPVVQVGVWFPTAPLALQALGLAAGTTRLFCSRPLCRLCGAACHRSRRR